MPLRALSPFRGSRLASARRHKMPLEVALLEGRVLLSGAADTTAPGTYVQFQGTLGQNDYYTSPVTLNFNPVDPDDASNTLTTYVSVNGSPNMARESVTLTGDGVYNVDYFSVDPAGNRETIEHQTIRIDSTAPSITANATPDVLWPPNHKLVPVTVTGHVADNLSGVVHTVTYHVADEYHQDQPSDTVTVDANGNYRFEVLLQSSRLGQDHDGRQYTIYVTAHDVAGNTATASTGVVVPHDMGHRFRNSNPGPIARGPSNPDFGEIRRERLAAREHDLQLRHAEAEAGQQQRIAIRHARQLQYQEDLQARFHANQVNHGPAHHAARLTRQVRLVQNHPAITLPSAPGNSGHGHDVPHGNGNGPGHGEGDSGNHGNGHGNSGNHGKGHGH